MRTTGWKMAFSKFAWIRFIVFVCSVHISTYVYSADTTKQICNEIADSIPGGRVINRHIGSTDQTVIQIKDLHANPTVQRNIARIIRYLEKFNVHNIFVEGYWGRYDISAVTNHPADVSLKKAVVEYFMKRGYISGVEYYAFTAPHAPNIYGIENKELYFQNKQAFEYISNHNKIVMPYLDNMSNILATIRGKLLSKRLKDFYTQYFSFFFTKKMGIESFTHYLIPYIQEFSITVDNKNFQLFTRLIELQHDVIPAQLESQIRGFVESIQKQFPSADTKLLLASMMQRMVGKISENQFFTLCQNFVNANKIDLSDYPQLKMRLSILSLEKTLDITSLMHTLHIVSEQIRDNLIAAPAERNICEVSDYVELLKFLVTVRLTSSELENYMRLTEQIGFTGAVDFIQQSEPNSLPVPSNKIFECIAQADQFYKLSSKRDGVLLEKTVEQVRDNSIKTCIQITGGFHSDYILEKLADNQFSYLAVLPDAGKNLNGTPYSAIMTGYPSYMERLLRLQTFRTAYLAPQLRGVELIKDALDKLQGITVSEQFSQTFFHILHTLDKLDYETGGTVLELFKSTTPLSAKLVDDFLAGRLTKEDTDDVLVLLLSSAPSPYLDARYLRKLRDNGYLDITEDAITEFEKVINTARAIDVSYRHDFVQTAMQKMEGEKTVEPNSVVRHYGMVPSIIDKFGNGSLVYISPEMKLLGGLRAWMAGGLGVLAGEFVEGVADMGIPTYGITIYNKKSVLQLISPEGEQTIKEVPIDFSKLPVYDTGIIIEENAMGEPIRARVWEIRAGSARIFALEDLTSDLTEVLYGGKKETSVLREQQNQLLGRGGIKALERLYEKGIITHPPAIVHLNEANCYCAADEIMSKKLFPAERDPDGLWQNVGIAFTTHTPVPAGLPMVYSLNYNTSNIIHLAWLVGVDPITLLMYYVVYPGGTSWNDLDEVVRNNLIQLLIDYDNTKNTDYLDKFIADFRNLIGSDQIVLNLTEGASSLANGSTSVSLRHEQVTNAEIIKNSKNSPARHNETTQATAGITNGVIAHDWQPTEFQGIDPNDIPDQVILATKRREKIEFLDMVNRSAHTNLSPDNLTIAIMRRINTYKRTDLMVKEIDELVEQLGDQQINVVYSGMPHEQDKPALELFKNVQAVIKLKHPQVHVAFVSQYDISVAKHGVRGADIWLMQPVEKKEASSTSHQKALLAGTLVISSYDGAMIENVVDFDIDPKNANGAFITPIILHRTVPRDQLNIINTGRIEGNVFDRPTIALKNGGEPFVPVAVMDQGDNYVIVDRIVNDLSAKNLKRILDENPLYLQQSDVKLRDFVTQDGSFTDDGYHTLMYDTLDPFSTSELHHLYDFNPTSWSSLLYRKIGRLAHVYNQAKQGDPEKKAMWVNMMRNSIRRTYEVDIHRMAAEYIRDIYEHILDSNKSLERIYPDNRLVKIARQWRNQFAKAKQEEFESQLAERLTWGYIDPAIGTQIENVRTLAMLDGVHQADKPLKIEADIQFGWVIQPEDIAIELHYGKDGDLTHIAPMELARTVDTINKKIRYTATVSVPETGNYSFKVVIKPVNKHIKDYLQFARAKRDAFDMDGEELAKITNVNTVMDKTLDDNYRKWSVQTAKLEIVRPITQPTKVFSIIDQRRTQQLINASL